MTRLVHWLTASFVAAALAPSVVAAQDMNIALSRLGNPDERLTNDVDGDGVYDPADGDTFLDVDGNGMFDPRCGGRVCQDDDAYRRVMTQFGASMIPPILEPAGTRGVRGIYVGFETWLTGIDNDAATPTGDAWFRAVEGNGTGTPDRSRFVDSVLAWGRINIRKGLPFGFELGTNVGYLFNTSYWSLGLSVKWALFEGFRTDVGWIPDVAVRGAVQTLMGDGEFNVTVPSVDIILSEPFVVANSVEITPSIMGQFAWIFADSELVDLTPGDPVFPECMPDPRTPEPGFGSPPYCRGDGAGLNDNIVFPSLRSSRIRVGAGLQIRYEWFVILASFLFDAAEPGELDSSLPADLPRQWQVDLGIGLTL